MTLAHKRLKDPDGVRRGLLDHASTLAAGRGLDDVTVAAVAAAAGVTKGALFHHFASKDALIDAMFDHQLQLLDERIDAMMDADPEPHGRFTRAYVLAATSVGDDERRIWGALTSVLLPGSALCRRWYAWLDARLDRHKATDHGTGLEVVRLAADGAWLMAVTRTPRYDMDQLGERLIAMTKP